MFGRGAGGSGIIAIIDVLMGDATFRREGAEGGEVSRVRRDAGLSETVRPRGEGSGCAVGGVKRVLWGGLGGWRADGKDG